MSNPFAHDTTSNAAGDFSFSDDRDVPARHTAAFQQAAGAPASNLGEQDYRFPITRQEGDQPGGRPGSYPNGYAP